MTKKKDFVKSVRIPFLVIINDHKSALDRNFTAVPMVLRDKRAAGAGKRASLSKIFRNLYQFF